MGTITRRETKKGVRYTAQIRLRREGVLVYQESQTFERKQTAQSWIRKRETELAQPGGLERAQRQGSTVRQMIGRYLEQYGGALGRTKEATLKAIGETWLGDLQDRDLTSQRLVECSQWRRPARVACGHAVVAAERVDHAVSPQVLQQRQSRRLHFLHDAAAQRGDDIDSLRTALRSAKGLGNFRNLFVHAPNGKKDGIQLITVSEVVAKDEFNAIEGITRDDMLNGLRIPPQLIGIVPQNSGWVRLDQVCADAANKLEPLHARLAQVN